MELLVFPDDVHDFLLNSNWMKAYQATSNFFDRQFQMPENDARVQRGSRDAFLPQWTGGVRSRSCPRGRAWEENARARAGTCSGQSPVYDIRGHVQKHTRTESRAVRNVVPQDFRQDFSGILRITVKSAGTENGKPLVRAVAEFEYP